MAGVKEVIQAVHTATAGADTTYTVAGGTRTRRVCFAHLGSGAGDIRWNRGAAATATKFPVFPQTYFVIDAQNGEAIHFWNTTVGDISIYVMELE